MIGEQPSPNRRRVLVTGGASGIGADIVRLLTARGYIVDFTHNSSNAPDQGGAGEALRYDLSSAEQVSMLADQLQARGHVYYGVVHNAGVSCDGLLASLDRDRAEALMRVNFWSFVTILKSLSPAMLRQRQGRVVAISSIAAERGSRGNAIYGASKAALNGLIRNLAVEFAPRGVTANAIMPGYIDTPMLAKYPTLDDLVRQTVPLARRGSGAEVGGLVSYLLSDEAAYLTGALLPIDGGLSGRA